jgi:serine/threonine protein kinase
MADLLRGFLALLKHKVIHRDMKPANVLRHGKLFKLCDFGFAKDVENYTEQLLRTIVGSPLYMAPQLLEKSKYTTKCDIWSLGVIWYEMVAGKTPWSGKSDVLLLENIKKYMPNFGPLFSSRTAAILRKMLAYE